MEKWNFSFRHWHPLQNFKFGLSCCDGACAMITMVAKRTSAQNATLYCLYSNIKELIKILTMHLLSKNSTGINGLWSIVIHTKIIYNNYYSIFSALWNLPSSVLWFAEECIVFLKKTETNQYKLMLYQRRGIHTIKDTIKNAVYLRPL